MFASLKRLAILSQRNRSTLLSWLLHCGAILLILAVTSVKPKILSRLHDILVVPADIGAYKPARPGGGGGGGGVHADSPASRGEAPPLARFQFAAPAVEILNDHPILPMAPTLIGNTEIQPASFDYKLYGDPNGVVGKPSGGPGDGGGIGKGHGTGVGPGNGPGKGPGEGGGEGGGAVEFRGYGSGVTPPSLITKTEPEYSEEARRARLQGTVRLRIVVDSHGEAQDIRVNQSLGLGLDDRAIDAVKKWKFKPGTVNGKPAAVAAFVEVNFRLL
jgi:periplasmic protein TonB